MLVELDLSAWLGGVLVLAIGVLSPFAYAARQHFLRGPSAAKTS